MADEMFDADDDVVGAEETQPGQKKVGFLPGVLIQVLKWVGIILGAVIFIVTIVVVVVRFLDRGNTGQTVIPTSSEYSPDRPILTWFEQIEELRGVTDDDVRTTYIVMPALGYDGENQRLTSELIARRIQLIGLFHDYLGSHSVDELEGPRNKQRVTSELMEDVNRLLRDGQIVEIVFETYQFIPF